MELEINQQIFIHRTPAQIWDFLLNQEGLKRWFQAREFVVDIGEGGGFKFTIERGGQLYRISGETGLLNFEKQMAFTWIEQDRYGRSWFAPTNVYFELDPAKEGTQFKLHHKGFKYLPGDSQAEICRQYELYWASVALPQLKILLDCESIF